MIGRPGHGTWNGMIGKASRAREAIRQSGAWPARPPTSDALQTGGLYCSYY